ncbi:hypothetical protein AB6D20_027810 (plasmid) [Vibrio splendidus]
MNASECQSTGRQPEDMQDCKTLGALLVRRAFEDYTRTEGLHPYRWLSGWLSGAIRRNTASTPSTPQKRHQKRHSMSFNELKSLYPNLCISPRKPKDLGQTPTLLGKRQRSRLSTPEQKTLAKTLANTGA